MFFKLLILFILIPVAELALFLTLGSWIGIGPTLAIIVLTAFLGAALTRAQGAKAIANFRLASAEGRLPAKEALDGLLILLAGAVLITPGFLTDTIGFLLLIPAVRAVFARWLGGYLKGKIRIVDVRSPLQPKDLSAKRDHRDDRNDSDVIDV